MSDSRIRSIVPMFGGATNYVRTLDRILDYVERAEPTTGELVEWHRSTFANVQKRKSIERRVAYLVKVGFLREVDGWWILDEQGERYIENKDREELFEIMAACNVGLRSLLIELASGGLSVEEINDFLLTTHDVLGWDPAKTDMAKQRVNWLWSMGLVERNGDIYMLSSSGREVVRAAVVESSETELSATEIAEGRRDLEQSLASPPQLTEDKAQYTTQRRRARNAAFASLVKEAYNYTCAICGAQRETPDGDPEVEAAHIYPKHKGGRDDVRNGFALCKLHHWAFDSGWISVTDECKIHVADEPARIGYTEFSELEGDRLGLPDEEDRIPHSVFLEAHRRQYGFE